MKTNSILKMALCAVGLAAFAVSAHAQIVVNYAENASGLPVLNGTSSDTSLVAPLAYTGTFWNENVGDFYGTNFGSGHLEDSTGVATTIGFKYSNPVTDLQGIDNNSGSNNPLKMLYFGSLWNASEPSTGGDEVMTITGLTSGAFYNLAIASNGFNAYGGTFTVGSTSLTATGESTDLTNTLVNGVNYVEFTNLQADGSGDIAVTMSPDAGKSVVIMNGFQIESVVAAPEPSTVALLGLGALGFAFLVHRHRTA